MDAKAAAEIFDRLDRELWLVTAAAGKRRSGLIATYVARVSLVPTLPRVTIALAKHHFTHELIETSGTFALHLMGENQIEWVWRFGVRSGRNEDKFHDLAIAAGDSGAPLLVDALAWLDCRVEERMDTGDRTVYLAAVLNAHMGGSGTALSLKRLLQIAPAERLRELKVAMEQDVEIDRAAILEWRGTRGR